MVAPDRLVNVPVLPAHYHRPSRRSARATSFWISRGSDPNPVAFKQFVSLTIHAAVLSASSTRLTVMCDTSIPWRSRTSSAQ